MNLLQLIPQGTATNPNINATITILLKYFRACLMKEFI